MCGSEHLFIRQRADGVDVYVFLFPQLVGSVSPHFAESQLTKAS